MLTPCVRPAAPPNGQVDPDIRVNEKDVRRVTPTQPWHPYMVYQHLYLSVMYGLLAFKSIYVDDFKSVWDGAIGAVRITRFTARPPQPAAPAAAPTRGRPPLQPCTRIPPLNPAQAGEAAVFWGGKAWYATYMLGLPLLFGNHGLGSLLAIWFWSDMVTGWMLAYMFQARVFRVFFRVGFSGWVC